MSRTLKRVPLDFSWPIGKIWKGYVNPHVAAPCAACKGGGYSAQARLFSDQWYGHASFDPAAYGAAPIRADHPILLERARQNVRSHPTRRLFPEVESTMMKLEAERLYQLKAHAWNCHLIQADVDALVAENRLYDFTRRPLSPDQECHENGWTKEPNGYRPTAAEVNDWALSGLGHDGINQNICLRARCLREGVPLTCDVCGGEGRKFPSKKAEEQYRGWQNTEPPSGEGYQLWETTSEGSPQSPVFGSLEELCAWCENNATTFGKHRTSAARWREMLEKDSVCHEETQGNTTVIFC